VLHGRVYGVYRMNNGSIEILSTTPLTIGNISPIRRPPHEFAD